MLVDMQRHFRMLPLAYAIACAADDGPANDEVTSASSTAVDGGSSSDGSGLLCNPPDSHEPNDSEDAAEALSDITDCDEDGTTLMGALDGDADEDWFTYRGTDVALCVVDPTRDVVASASLRLCKFAQCIDGQVDLGACPEGSTAATTDAGNPGCCREGSSITNFALVIACSGISDDANIIVRLDRGAAGECTSYTLDRHY